MLKFLILLNLLSFATSQSNFNISIFDAQLHDIFNGLVATEKKIGSFLSNLNNFVDEFNGNFKSNKSRLFMDLSHLQLILQLQSSIGNYEAYQTLTGCNNVASKISEIDVDLKKFSDFVDRLELNMTELYHRNLHVTYGFIMRFRQSNNSQQDMLDIILGVNEAIVQYLFYILQLQVNIQYEKSIKGNLNLFLNHFCECDDSVYGVSHNTNSNVTLRDMEEALIARQARIVDAANSTLVEAQKIKESLNATGMLKVMSKKLVKFCKKLMKIDDYSNETISITTNCAELTKVQNFMTYRRFHYTQVLSFVMTNSTVLGFFKNLTNFSTDNTTKDLEKNSTFLGSVTVLETELKNYTDDLALQLSYLTLFASAMRKDAMVMKLFCGCKPKSATTTTTKTTRKLTFSSATFLSTTTTISSLDSTKISKTTTKKPRTATYRTSSTPKTTIITTKMSTRAPKIRPSTTKLTTLAPFFNPACNFTKPLTDMNGIYIKTACLMEMPSNSTLAKSKCQDNSMQLMTIDSNMTQTALAIFVQETLSEGSFWIGGGNGSELCNFAAVNKSGLFMNQIRCSTTDYYSICEYQDSTVPSKLSFPINLDACGFVFPILIDSADDYTRYGCIMAYTRSYINSRYNCMLNGMNMLKMEPIKLITDIDFTFVSFFGNNSGVMMWVDATIQGTNCSLMDGNKVPFAVGGDDCGQLHWSICEAPYDGSY